MANEEQLANLRSGVVLWNARRNAQPDVRPDLSEVYLDAAQLDGVNLATSSAGISF
jgi:hypothetical protein